MRGKKPQEIDQAVILRFLACILCGTCGKAPFVMPHMVPTPAN